MKDIFAAARVSDEDFKPFERKVPTEPSYSDSLIQAYTAFRDRVYNPASVLHPSCSLDASPSRVFRDVTFVDTDEEAINVLKKSGLDAIACDIRKYRPKKKHDLLILLNPAIDTEWASQHIIQGAYILANDYHENASDMHDCPENFQFIGAMDWANERRGKNSPVIYTDLSGFFEPVKSFDELESASPERHHVLKNMVEFLLKSGGKKLSGNFEKDYRAYCKLLNGSTELPEKRIADMYIFRKK